MWRGRGSSPFSLPLLLPRTSTSFPLNLLNPPPLNSSQLFSTHLLSPLFLSRPRPLFLSLQLPQGAAAPRKVLTSGKDIKATQFTIGLSSKKGKTVSIGFTKENELFVGRMAQLGFAASLIGEGITGKGFLGQLGFETGIPLIDVDFFLAVSIAFTLFAAINEGSGKFVDEDE